MKKLMMVFAVGAAIVMTGCSTPGKMRDIELKGMYVNGYSEVLAIGSGKLTSIPGEREALAAHYEEDTAWLQPNVKTHKIDIFMVGTNSTTNANSIISNICKAFADVAPTIAKENTEVAKGVATVTPLGVVKSGGEVRKAVESVKATVKGATANGTAATSGTDAAGTAAAVRPAEDCPDCTP